MAKGKQEEKNPEQVTTEECTFSEVEYKSNVVIQSRVGEFLPTACRMKNEKAAPLFSRSHLHFQIAYLHGKGQADFFTLKSVETSFLTHDEVDGYLFLYYVHFTLFCLALPCCPEIESYLILRSTAIAAARCCFTLRAGLQASTWSINAKRLGHGSTNKW